MPCSSCDCIERRWFGGTNPLAVDAMELWVVANATSPRLRAHSFTSPLHLGLAAAASSNGTSVVAVTTRANAQASPRHRSARMCHHGSSLPTVVSDDVDTVAWSVDGVLPRASWMP